jgi:murein DD-endopeptidase MepM/ murein hydrolase activator NlpD
LKYRAETFSFDCPFCFLAMRLLFFIFIFSTALSQDYPKDFFRMPVDTTVSLSGNFAEIRHDHFHYGWDIRTGGKEGLKIVAAGDGYVSRLKVSPYGYGKVIYITHPNGYVTVYAHLSDFSDSIGRYVKKGQYENESFEVELFPKAGDLPVKKGEIIGRSGNTGYSEAPTSTSRSGMKKRKRSSIRICSG